MTSAPVPGPTTPLALGDRPHLDIVIVSYNTRDLLDECLASVFGGGADAPFTVVVVDNASRDGSAEMVRARWPAVRLLARDDNAGFARATNAGVRATRGEAILLLNSDTRVPPGALGRLMAGLRADAAAAVAGPRLVDERGRVEISDGPMMSPWGELRQKVRGGLYARGIGPVVRAVERAASTQRYVDWVSGACLLAWRRDAEAVGLLDERYFMYAEDVDFCAAIRARGRRVLFLPDAEVIHRRGASRQAAPAATAHAYRRSQLAFYEKHHPRWAPILRAYQRARTLTGRTGS
jgi:GT2 family glycosyltransferase